MPAQKKIPREFKYNGFEFMRAYSPAAGMSRKNAMKNIDTIRKRRRKLGFYTKLKTYDGELILYVSTKKKTEGPSYKPKSKTRKTSKIQEERVFEKKLQRQMQEERAFEKSKIQEERVLEKKLQRQMQKERVFEKKTKKIEGKVFYDSGTTRIKSEAQKYAEELRNRGYRARVIKAAKDSTHNWEIWSRKK